MIERATSEELLAQAREDFQTINRLRRENQDALQTVAMLIAAAGGSIEVANRLQLLDYEVKKIHNQTRDSVIWEVSRIDRV